MFGRIVDWILALIALVGIAGTGAWAVYGNGQGAEMLEEKIEKRAAEVLSAGGYDWAEVKLDGQTATISGQSPGDGAGNGAIEALKEAGLLGGLVSGPITSLADEVMAAAPISPYVWSAEKTSDGQIILSGYAPDRSTIDALVMDAQAMAPGEVDNRLRVGAGQPRGEWLSVVHKGILQLENLEYGRIELIDSRMRIEGLALSPEYRASLEDGLSGLDANYQFESGVRGAGLWSASISSGELTLDGVVTSETERRDLLALAEQAFSGTVIDRMRVRDHGHQGWIQGVRSLLPQFLKFRSGIAIFDPESDGYRLSGEAAGSTLSYLREDMSGVTNFPVNIEVDVVEQAVAEIEGIDFSDDLLTACQAAFQAVLSGNRVTFESGKDSIDRSSGETLDKLMSVAQRCDGLIFEVGGHTDSQGDRGFNISLSRSRAQAVADYMTARGIAADRIDAVGFGPDVPLADNTSRDGRAANRRIEFKVVEEG